MVEEGNKGYVPHGCSEQFIIISIGLAKKLSSTISQDPQKWDSVLIKKGDCPVIQNISRIDWYLAGIKFCKFYGRVGINECLLVNMAYILHSAHVKCILSS